MSNEPSRHVVCLTEGDLLMEEVVAAEGVMSQSLFDLPAVAQAGGVLEQMAEGQEQLRGELGLVAERLDRLERTQSNSEANTKAAVAELTRCPPPSRLPLYASIGAAVLAMAALAVALI